ncbi:AB hydrolase-1 domain-containing protein [Balamuthia mandrillaris]
MGGIVAKQAFLPPPSSYDDSLEHLTWVSKPRCSDKVPVLWLQRSKSARFTIIFSHGNAEDIGQLSHWLQHICKKMEVNVITYDYIGYGLHKADSLPSEASCFADVLAVYRFATEQEGVPPSRIILYGRSLGSGPTCWLASHLWNEWRKSLKAKSCKRSGGFLSSILSPSASTEPSQQAVEPPAAVILQSPIASCIRVVSDGLAKLPGLDMFVNIDRIPKIGSPVFIIHGSEDEVVPYVHGQQLYANLSTASKGALGGKVSRMCTLDGAGHNNIEFDFLDELMEALGGFLDDLEAGIKEKEEHEDVQEEKETGGSSSSSL